MKTKFLLYFSRVIKTLRKKNLRNCFIENEVLRHSRIFLNLLNTVVNLGTVCMLVFIFSSCFPLKEKRITSVLYFIMFAVSISRANLKKRNTDAVPGSGSSRTSFPGCLFSFSYTTKGFLGECKQ